MRRRINEQDNDRGIYSQFSKKLVSAEDADEPEMTVGEDLPIDPGQQMATQLSVERPPIEDDDFVPSSVAELARSASAISEEVPANEVEWYYKQLHKLLDSAVDRSATTDPPEEEENHCLDQFEKHFMK